MSEIKWTKLRHQMLAMIAQGGVTRSRTGSLTWYILDGLSAKQGFQQRAVTDLVHARAAEIVHDGTWVGGPVAVTARGAQLLVNWDEAKGVARSGGEGDPK